VIQGTFGVIQGTFGVIQGIFCMIQGTSSAIASDDVLVALRAAAMGSRQWSPLWFIIK
jgi:hypothetical protein